MSLEKLTSKTTSWTGPYLYQPNATQLVKDAQQGFDKAIFNKGNILAVGAQVPCIGSLAGVTRMALAVIHCIGHLVAAAMTCDSGHLYHTLRGTISFAQGAIESIPFIGRIFAIVHFHFKLIAAIVQEHNIFKETPLQSLFRS